MNQAKRLFHDSIDYNKQMTKNRAKPKCKGVYRIVTPKEVLEKLSELGINISERTLQRYVKQGLIPAPERKSAGRGKGKITDYPSETVAEAYASKLMIDKKLPVELIVKARNYALLAKAGQIDPVKEIEDNLEGTSYLDTLLWGIWWTDNLVALKIADKKEEFENNFAVYSNIVKRMVVSSKRLQELNKVKEQ